MNTTEQRNHKRVVDELASAIGALSSATAERCANIESRAREDVNAERTHRLKLAEEQRSYVDARDRELRECCQERWNETGLAQRRIIDRIDSLYQRPFFGRLKWLFVGR